MTRNATAAAMRTMRMRSSLYLQDETADVAGKKLRRYASRPMLVAGVRYRFANGLRAAMSVWGTLLVASAIAAGLKATPPFVAWGHAWMAVPLPRRLLIDAAVAIVLGFSA